jgi:SPP1 family predicted phage head-tail adaptor
MRAGRLDRSIELQSLSTTNNSFGEPVETWTTIATVAAAVTPNRGNERFTAQQVVGHAVVTFKIRYRTGLTVLNRIRYQGRQWDIHDVREVGRREGLEIDASARSES